ncbi:MAG TPA: branched-chain amino acid ABC transporter permease [Candidatus Dormibacteraeota bacterium]|nr:branched-chain amino acid ABC transporter permease [Candidatus Dormibacteraeota bacterium]
MPERVAGRIAGDVDLPTTAAETREQESSSVYWLLVIGGLVMLAGGWLLPWFVEPTANGIGASPMDAVASPPRGVGSLLVYLMGLSLLGLLAGAAYDAVCLRSRRGEPYRWARQRAVLAAVGMVCTITVWYLIAKRREEPLFGQLSPLALTDNAVWLTLTGFALCCLAYGFRRPIAARSGLTLAAVALVVGALVPLIFHQSIEFISWAAGAAAIYTLLALGLNVVVGFAGLLDLGYAAFFAIGAYTCGSLASSRHGDVLHIPFWPYPFWIILFLGAAVAALFGALLGAPTLRLRGDYLAIVTLGFGEIIPDAANNNAFGQTGGPNGITGIHHPSLFGHDFGIDPRPYYYALLVLIALIIVVLRNLERSRIGRAWVAVREDEVAASATGINTVSTKLLAFAIGAAVSGFAGAFYGAELGIVSPDDFQFAVSVTALSTVVLGGIGSITGAAVGGLLISFIIFWILPHAQEWSMTFGNTTGFTALSSVDYSKYVYVAYGVILVSIMLLRPAGLIPSRARKVELQAGGESEPLAAVRGRA